MHDDASLKLMITLLPILVIGAVVQFVWSSVVSIVLFRVSRADRNVEQLEAKLHSTTERLIDERFRSISHQVAESANQLVGSIELIKARLADGDDSLEGLLERDHQLELKYVQKISDLKDWIITSSASKQDVTKHQESVSAKFDKLGEQMAAVGAQVAGLTMAVNRRPAR